MRLWSRAPVGSFRSRAAPGTAQYFADLRAYRYGYETPFITRLFSFERMVGRRVLEIGVGNGVDAVEMARAGAHYTGIDVTARHLELTAANFALAGLPPPQLLCAQLPTAPLAGPFDFVYSFGVLHHIPEEPAYLRRVRELLAPGGRLLLGVYSKYSFFNAYLCATWLLRQHARRPLDDWRSHVAEGSPLGDPVTIRIRSARKVRSLLRACGFAVIAYHKRGFVQRYLPGVGRYLEPDGAVLNGCGALLGWYHLMECVPTGTA
ncbi:MAG TPA: class I SAM-dependent methyltransferase [Steroidobacteraceae bacterium]|nr:class I SAM-dependent methyltransferase [Steroidobacteraceae bacterium]